MRRLAFGRPWRQTEGLSGTLMHLLGLDLSVPDHATVDRRSPNLAVAPTSVTTEGPIMAVIDCTGPKVVGRGVTPGTYGGTIRRSRRKLHLAADPDTGVGLASELTGIEDGDASVVVPLLDWIKRPVGTVLVERAYDNKPVYRAIAERGLDFEVIIPTARHHSVERRCRHGSFPARLAVGRLIACASKRGPSLPPPLNCQPDNGSAGPMVARIRLVGHPVHDSSGGCFLTDPHRQASAKAARSASNRLDASQNGMWPTSG